MSLGCALGYRPLTSLFALRSAPSTVADLTATALGTTSVLLEWSPASRATYHEYRIDSGTAVVCDDNTGAQTVIALTANTSYNFEVRGVNGLGAGAWSNVAVESTDPLEGLAAPVVTLTSAAGDPPEATISNLIMGLYVRCQRTTTAGNYTSPTLDVLYGPVSGDDTANGIDNAKWALAGYVDPTGVWAQRYRYERDDGATSDWSNEISGEVTVSVATWNPTTGVNKSQWVAVSNADKTLAVSADVGFVVGARATVPAQTDVADFEATIDGFRTVGETGRIFIGITNSTMALGPAEVAGDPGIGGRDGACIYLTPGDANAAKHINGVETAHALPAGDTAGVGDKVRVAIDKATNTVEWYYTPSGGVEALLTSGVISTGIPDDYYAYSGGYWVGDQITADFTNYG